MVQIGDKVIDYNEDFRLFMATRNPTPLIPPDAVSVVTEVNFTTTRAGLRGQVTHSAHALPHTHTSTHMRPTQCVNASAHDGAVTKDGIITTSTLFLSFIVMQQRFMQM